MYQLLPLLPDNYQPLLVLIHNHKSHIKMSLTQFQNVDCSNRIIIYSAHLKAKETNTFLRQLPFQLLY